MNVDKEIALLQQLVAVRSFSREEDGTATVIYDYLSESGISPERYGNNVWAVSDGFDPALPTLMLNSHHDTVRPAGILFLRILRMVCCMVWAVMMPGLQWCRL